MTNNDILRRVRYILGFNDKEMISVFRLLGKTVTQEQLVVWLRREDDPEYKEISDLNLCIFLDGLIIHKRGKKNGVEPKAIIKLTNNIIFRKLAIALNLKSEEIIEILLLNDFILGKHELSAFFRKKSHKNYRECKDQILRKFLKGLQLKYKK